MNRKIRPRKIIYILIITNLITFLGLVYLLIRTPTFSKVIDELTAKNAPPMQYSYAENLGYEVRRILFSIYQPRQVNIVMFGDSLIEHASWDELLSREDIVNRGIAGDILQGYLNRLKDIYLLKPKLCLLIGGVNDIRQGFSPSEILAQYQELIEALLMHNIQPVIQSTLYISSKRSNFREVNQQITILNQGLSELSKAKSIEYVDINAVLAKDAQLQEEYTYDGVHLLGNAYQAWRDVLLPILTHYQIN